MSAAAGGSAWLCAPLALRGAGRPATLDRVDQLCGSAVQKLRGCCYPSSTCRAAPPLGFLGASRSRDRRLAQAHTGSLSRLVRSERARRCSALPRPGQRYARTRQLAVRQVSQGWAPHSTHRRGLSAHAVVRLLLRLVRTVISACTGQRRRPSVQQSDKLHTRSEAGWGGQAALSDNTAKKPRCADRFASSNAHAGEKRGCVVFITTGGEGARRGGEPIYNGRAA